MRLSTAMKHLESKYLQALRNPKIKKPVSWALYQTWKWADTYEKERKEENGRI
jgi:hypothetical protein